MRPKERIPIFLDLVDWKYLTKRWNLGRELDNFLLNHIDYYKILPYWNENSDQRFGQVLINLGLLEDNFEIWIDEELNILLDQEIEPREFLFWGRNYNKEGNLLDKTEYILIKDLETDHIKNIFKFFKNINKEIHPLYKETLLRELELRNEKTHS